MGKKRVKILTVTIKDCRVDTLRGSGKGGQNRNKRDTAVRVTHEPSKAVGYCETYKTQGQNKKEAFRKMANSEAFKLWVRMEAGGRAVVEENVKKAMDPANIKEEVREDGIWRSKE